MYFLTILYELIMGQTRILEHMIAYSNKMRLSDDPSKRRDISPEVIQSFKKGHCMGFSLCYGLNDWLDRNYPEGSQRNLERWLIMSDYILLWDKHKDPNSIDCYIPLLTKETLSTKKKLADIFDEVMPLIIEYQAFSAIDVIPMNTVQICFMDKPEKKFENKKTKTTPPKRLELVVFSEEKKSAILQVKANYKTFYLKKNNEWCRNILRECLENNVTQSHIKTGMYHTNEEGW